MSSYVLDMSVAKKPSLKVSCFQWRLTVIYISTGKLIQSAVVEIKRYPSDLCRPWALMVLGISHQFLSLHSLLASFPPVSHCEVTGSLLAAYGLTSFQENPSQMRPHAHTVTHAHVQNALRNIQ